MADNTDRLDARTISTARGIHTSPGQFTAIFSTIALLLSIFGLRLNGPQLEDWATTVNNVLVTIGPLLAVVPVLVTYINSRGKIASNVVNAQAQVQAPPDNITSAPLVDDRFTQIIGGDDWKDPERYGNLIKIAEAVGVPGAKQADAANEKFHVDDLLKSILDRTKKDKD